MASASFSPHIDAYIGLSALAARALRVLGDSSTCCAEDPVCQQESALASVPISTLLQHSPQLSALAFKAEQDWALAAVPHLARLLHLSSMHGKGNSQPLRPLSSSSQRRGKHLLKCSNIKCANLASYDLLADCLAKGACCLWSFIRTVDRVKCSHVQSFPFSSDMENNQRLLELSSS